MEEEEVRPLIKITSTNPSKLAIVKGLASGFEYFEKRITGNCDAIFSCEHTYEVFKLIQVFDPSFAVAYLNPGWINALMKIQPLAANNLIPGLLAESHTYLTLAAPCQGFNSANVGDYTVALLKWWKANHPTIPTWAKAARIIFAMTPSSAASERVFSLVDAKHVRLGPQVDPGRPAAGLRHAQLQQASRWLSWLAERLQVEGFSPQWASGGDHVRARG